MTLDDNTRPLEERDDWPEIQTALEAAPLPEVAATFGVAPAQIRAAQRRTNGAGRIRVVRPERETSVDSEGASAPGPAAPSQRPRPRATPAADRLASHAHLLGVEPDRVVAELAAVSVGTVRNIRRERGIAGAPRKGKGKAKRRVKKGEVQPSNSEPTAARRREAATAASTRLSAHSHLLGQVSDREVARIAGVHPNTARKYRSSRGLPPAPRASRRTTATHETRVPRVQPHVESTTQWLWKVDYGTSDEGYVVGGGIGEVAQAVERAGVANVVRIQRVERILA